MHSSRVAHAGNPFIGLFAKTNDKFTLVPSSAHEKFVEAAEVLGTELAKLTIANSEFVGIYTAMNNNGIAVPNLIGKHELADLEKLGIEVYVSNEKRNAFGNNIAVNGKGGIVNEEIDEKEKKNLEQCFGVPLERFRIADYEAVGSCCVVTDKGFVAHNEANEEEIDFLESVFKVKGTIGTINMGTGFVGAGLIANCRGYVAGERTGGFEMMRIDQGLELVE